MKVLRVIQFGCTKKTQSRRASFWVGNNNTTDTVYAYVDYEPKDNEYLKDVQGCATFALT